MRFKKKLMIARLKKEGLSDKITPEIEKIMNNLDGCEATSSCWNRRVFDDPVLYVVGKDGTGQYVNENDCE